MKLILKIILLFFVAQIGVSQHIHIGNYEGAYLFDDFKQKKVFSLKNDTLTALITYSEDRAAEYANDSIIIFQNYSTDEPQLIINYLHNDSSITIHLQRPVFGLTVQENKLFYSDSKSREIHFVQWSHWDESKNLQIEGSVLNFKESEIIYVQSNEKSIHADAFLKKATFRNGMIIKIEVILKNISGENAIYCPNLKMLFDFCLSDGKFNPFLFNLNTSKKTEKFRLVIEDQYLKVSPFFDSSKNILVFYNSQTLELFNYSLNDANNDIKSR